MRPGVWDFARCQRLGGGNSRNHQNVVYLIITGKKKIILLVSGYYANYKQVQAIYKCHRNIKS